MLGIFHFGGGEIILLLGLAFWIWMLLDCIKNPRLSNNERLIWVLVVLCLNALGGLIYFFARRNQASE